MKRNPEHILTLLGLRTLSDSFGSESPLLQSLSSVHLCQPMQQVIVQKFQFIHSASENVQYISNDVNASASMSCKHNTMVSAAYFLRHVVPAAFLFTPPTKGRPSPQPSTCLTCTIFCCVLQTMSGPDSSDIVRS